ncbi:hypothetical protein [Paenibacillus sp. UNC499MF]|uniref:hypothetical protein n=1 Tax=Paenibacillus sp. UNC499MF TaxID=1502751 RepID=UPI000CDE7E15|nr:hypothetical protein [Paenibacillus sp. UNC499MF]
MKKFRGKRRYFRQLWKQVNAFYLQPDNESWFDFWHFHLDFCGIGENSVKLRREHIKAHIALYKSLLKRLERIEKPSQSWICLHEEDAGLDAVYIHTSNPNRDNFPHKFDTIDWKCKIPAAFNDLIDPDLFHVGYNTSDDGGIYFIQSKEQDIKLF